MEPAYKYSASTSIKAEQQLDYKINDKLNVTVGGTYENLNTIPQSADLAVPVNPKNNVSGRIAGSSSFHNPEGISANFYNVRYENAGAYIQTQYSPNSVFGFTLGARFDNNSRYGNTFNPRMGIVITPNSRLNIKALFGSAFLAPAPSTAYVQYGSFTTADSGRTYHSTFLHLPNPGLKPIRSENFELNIRQYITNSFTVTADAYYSLLNGLHIFADDNTSTRLYKNNYNGIPVDYIEVFVNQGRQINYGGSLQLNLKHTLGSAFLNSWASIAYVNGLISNPKNEGEAEHFHSELPFISPFTLRIGTDIQTKKFTFSPRLMILSRQNLPGVKDTIGEKVQLQTIAGYALLNLSTRYQLTKQFSIFMNVKNALDRRYRSVSYLMDLTKKDTELFHGSPEDPIRIMGGINFRIN
jgi:iron complex outermembrane receptor protein